MSFVILAVPYFKELAVRMIEVTANLPGVELGLISQDPQEWLPDHVRNKLACHWRIADGLDANQLADAVQALVQQKGAVHRLFTPVEQMQVQVAEVRERFGIAGMSSEIARNFRDKARMKNLLRAADLPCARHRQVASASDAWDFADASGYPLVIKPLAGAATQATHKVDNADQLRQVLSISPPSPSGELIIEEFITGDEQSFDTFSLSGQPVFHSLTHYHPPPLDVMRHPWIQWCVLLPREIDSPQYDDVRQIAFRALQVLGMDTGMTHLEWFRRRDGSLAISEVAARPPGAQITTLISRANDFDSIAAWARLIVHGKFEAPQRKYAVGCAYLRGQGQGRVSAVHGLAEATRAIGHLVCDAKLPTVGQTPSGTYEGEGYVIVRHPETKVVEDALQKIITTVHIELG